MSNVIIEVVDYNIGVSIVGRATCPFCQQNTVITHSESAFSPYGVELFCVHAHSYGWTRAGAAAIEFEQSDKEVKNV